MNVGSLFTGIGGFDLGLERAGMEVVWQCESDPFCRRVLARHWPGVPCYPDITTLQAPPAVDLLCGGFPCQDLSFAGRGQGIDGERSGLWQEYARLVRELRPRYVIVENVPALLVRGAGRVLADLAACGYNTEWDCLPACAFGAPHRRDRLWLVAYPNRERQPQRCREMEEKRRRPRDPSEEVPHPDHPGRLQHCGTSTAQTQILAPERGRDLPDPTIPGREGRTGLRPAGTGTEWRRRPGHPGWWATEPDLRGIPDGFPKKLDRDIDGLDPLVGETFQPEAILREMWSDYASRVASHGRRPDEQLARELANSLPLLPYHMALAQREAGLAAARSFLLGLRQALSSLGLMQHPLDTLPEAWVSLSEEDQAWVFMAMDGRWWAAEWPGVSRIAYRVPNRVDRLRALGNALVPQIAEWIGRQILAWEAQ